MLQAADRLQIAALALLVVVVAILLIRRRRVPPGLPLAPMATTLLSILLVVSLGTATIAFGNGYHNYDCGQDVVSSQAAVGTYLLSKIPPHASVYWASGGVSPIPLSYLDQPTIFPPQLNGIYSYRIGGAPDSLSRFGYWNASLASSWLSQADYVLMRQEDFHGSITYSLRSKDFDQITPSPPANPCDPGSSFLIFRRVAAGASAP
jgi:hypothetical protein